MQKLLRIGQISNLYGISLDALRYYDRKGLLKPVVDEQNGYRYYSLEHLDVLEMILVGKYLEIPLDQMKEKIDLESIDGYLAMIEEQRRFIEEKRDVLKRLSQYTREMSDLLKNIKKFDNDKTFSQVTIEKNMDITIYNVDPKNFLNNGESSQIYLEIVGILVSGGMKKTCRNTCICFVIILNLKILFLILSFALHYRVKI